MRYVRDSISYKILVGKLERKKPLGRHWYRWKDNF
jgi:hypothetical protein